MLIALVGLTKLSLLPTGFNLYIELNGKGKVASHSGFSQTFRSNNQFQGSYIRG